MQTRKRDGPDMDIRTEDDVEDRTDGGQVAEAVRKKMTEDRVTKEMMSRWADEAASKAAEKVMQAMAGEHDRRENSLFEQLRKSLADLDTGLMGKMDQAFADSNANLNGRMTAWEMKLQSQWSAKPMG